MVDAHEEYKVVEVISGRNEFQLYMMILVTISGLSLLFGGPPPGSVQELYPNWVIYVWAIGLAVGGITNLLGVLIHWRDVLTSVYIEMISMVQLVVAGVIYSTAAIIFAKKVIDVPTSYIGVAFVSILAVASLWRLVRLGRWAVHIRNLRRLHSRANDLIENGSELPDER